LAAVSDRVGMAKVLVGLERAITGITTVRGRRLPRSHGPGE
jgi:hypothetical protein